MKADVFFSLWQTAAKAIEFYEQKVKELETNLTELEKLVQTKSGQQRLFEDGECQQQSIFCFSVISRN
jgi:prefoldin subunit 5